MNKEQQNLYNFLSGNPGYLKTNFNKLGSKFNLNYSDVKDVVRSVKSQVTSFDYSKPNRDIPHVVELQNEVLRLRQLVNEVKNSRDIVKKVKSLPDPYLKGDLNNILVIGDTHIPFTREGYLEHCRAVQEQFNCGTVIHIGDLIDNCYSSFHESNPDGKSAGDELASAIEILKDWYHVFPTVSVTLGNHDNIIQRKAFSSGLSTRWIKGLNEVLEVPNWQFDLEYEINNVIYTHGTGTSGDKGSYNRALNRRKSIVSGHLHTTASVNWNVSDVDKIFAMQVGCGIDDKQYSFDYAKAFTKKSIISCAVVLNKGTLPIIIPMEL